jgi:hypothetical protein
MSHRISHRPVKANYNFITNKSKMLKAISKFPIYSSSELILNTLRSNLITIIESPPGSGKTLGIPYIVSTTGHTIFVAKDTKLGVLSSSNMQESLSKNITVSCAFEDNDYISGSKIVYATCDYLNVMMMDLLSGKTSNRFCDVLIIDDYGFNEKSIVCLHLWIKMYENWKEKKSVMPPKLILSSIGLDCSQINLPVNPGILSLVIKDKYSVNTVYFNEKYICFNMDEKILNDTANLVYDYHSQKHDGIYLVFVPGQQELDIQGILIRLFKSDAYIITVDLNTESIELPPVDKMVDKKIIILSTSEMDTSLFVKDITLVIDTIRTRQKRDNISVIYDMKYGRVCKNSMLHRRGRTGRTCNGIYHVMISEEQYNDIPDQTILYYSDPTTLITQLIERNLDLTILYSVMSMDRVQNHLSKMKYLGLIDSTNSVLTVSEMCHFCMKYPFGFRFGIILYEMQQRIKNISQDEFFVLLATLCTISEYESGIFFSKRNIKYGSNFNDEFSGYSDIDVILNVWILICQSLNPFYLGHKINKEISDTNLYRFCVTNGLNFRMIKKIVKLLDSVKHIFNFESEYVLNHNYKTFALDENSFSKMSTILYDLMEKAFADYLIKIYHKGYRKDYSDYNFYSDHDNLTYKIDSHSCRTVSLKKHVNRFVVCLQIINRYKQKTTGELQEVYLVNLLHVINDKLEDDNISIFSSSCGEISDLDFGTDTETDEEILVDNLEKLRYFSNSDSESDSIEDYCVTISNPTITYMNVEKDYLDKLNDPFYLKH